MAALTGRIINDQNLGLNFNGGGSVGGNINAAGKAQTKGGGLGGRKPLGDLSNAGLGKPSLNHQAPKKQTSQKFPLINEEIIESSKIKSKKTSTFKASDKKVSTRKALSDISNSEKKLNIAPEAPKNKTQKLSVLAEDSMDIGAIVEEGFLHNHQECIKQQERASAMDMDYFMETMGPNKTRQDQSTTLSSARMPLLSPDSPPRFLEDEEEEFGFSPRKDNASPTWFWTPVSSEPHMGWNDMDFNFSLVESPNRNH